MAIERISPEEALQTLPILSQSARAAAEDAGETHALHRVADDFRTEVKELVHIFPGNENVAAAMTALERDGLTWQSFQTIAGHFDALANELANAA